MYGFFKLSFRINKSTIIIFCFEIYMLVFFVTHLIKQALSDNFGWFSVCARDGGLYVLIIYYVINIYYIILCNYFNYICL